MNRYSEKLTEICESQTLSEFGSFALEQAGNFKWNSLHNALESDEDLGMYLTDFKVWFEIIKTLAGLLSAMTNEELAEFKEAL